MQQNHSRARKIIEKAERQLLQDRVRGINKTIEESGNYINNRKTRLASLVTNTTDRDRYSKFIDKVREDRYTRVKARQVRKFHNLFSKSKQINDSNINNNGSSLGRDANSSDRPNNYKLNNNKSQSQDNINNKWVINLSSISLTEWQKSVLAKGPHYSLTPKFIPNVDYITAMETMCLKLKEEEAIELRLDVNALLRKAKAPKPNLNRQKSIGLAQPKKDKDRVIRTLDKDVAMVVMDREDYANKVQELLAQPAYRSIPKDPTNKVKAQFITRLRKIKKDTNMDEGMYKAMYPTGCFPKFYGLPKIHKTDNSLRPIFFSRGSVTYGVAKVLSNVPKSLVGKSPHYIQNTGNFVSRAKGLTLQWGECLTSYDVTPLFTSVPIDLALNIIKDLFEKDGKLNDRTVLSVLNIVELLGFCLHNTYFSFQNKFYEQVEEVAMSSPVSPIVANLYMEYFERKALVSAINLPQVWYRFVDDTWVFQQQAHKQAFLDYINSIDPAIKFTVEGTQGNGAISFFDTLVTPLADNSLSITVYHKPTHMDQYSQWDSHHSLSAKCSVIGILTHRAKTICTNPELLQKE